MNLREGQYWSVETGWWMAYAGLARTLSELKATINAGSKARAGARARRGTLDIVEARDRITIVVVDPKGKRVRMQVPVGSMSRLQDFLEDKCVHDVLRSPP